MNSIESRGQNIEIWTNEWKNVSIESEILMWDFFGLRPWILKYTPRFGEVLEAGCGLGRYNFYLSHLGIDITGLDFSKETIEHLNIWQNKNGFNLKFISGDIKKLPYEDNSLSGYLSFGVIEHFQEGPKEVLDEVYRVLRPGGIAIITTPNKSWNVYRIRFKKGLKNKIKKMIGRDLHHSPFFQYEYSPNELKKFMKNSGLKPTEVRGGDFLYSFYEYGKFGGRNISEESFAYKVSSFLDNTTLNKFGAQSITINIKEAENMYCFLCGMLSAQKNSLNTHNVPLCEKCSTNEISKYYLKSSGTAFNRKYHINRPILLPEKRECDYCKSKYETDILFEDFGLAVNVCKDCLRKPGINIEISNLHVQPIWRKRK